MRARTARKPRPPLDDARLNELALAYVARFATSRAKLAAYLRRKVRERGWDGASEAPIAALVEKAVRAGYVDDAAFALSKARSLTARGYGGRRVDQAMRAAGITEEDSAGARDHVAGNAVEAALSYARRRRLGPYGAEAANPVQREKNLAAMIRAGHDFRLAQAILSLPPGTDPDLEVLGAPR